MAHSPTTNRSVVRFERGLCPRKPVRGEVRKGGGAPLRVPYRCTAGTQAVVRPPIVSCRIFSPRAVTASAARPQR
jgi:hypothetical protein